MSFQNPLLLGTFDHPEAIDTGSELWALRVPLRNSGATCRKCSQTGEKDHNCWYAHVTSNARAQAGRAETRALPRPCLQHVGWVPSFDVE
jgi:hypothetical protein